MKKIIFILLITLFSSQVVAQEKLEAISPKQVAMTGFADTIEELMPAVVNISATEELQSGNTNVEQMIGELPKTPLFDDFRSQLENQFRGGGKTQKKKVSSIGSGFLISKDGYVVTNNHVIDEADDIVISLNDGTKYKAKLVGSDKKTDLALLKINADKDLKFVKFGDSNKSRIGDWVIAIGNPYGLGGSVSVGIVSARGRDITNGQSDDFIQTDAAINKGNSGGPIFNSKGEVIGVSAAIYSPSGGSVGIGFATPSATALQVINQLKDQGEVIRGWLGVAVQDVTDELAESMKMEKTKGAFVTEVTKDGPADKAGILATDVIIKFEDQEITEMKILPKTVAKFPINKTAKVTVLRRGKVKIFNVKITKMKEEKSTTKSEKIITKKPVVKATQQILGIGLAELSASIKKGKNIEASLEGLLVVDVFTKSDAAEKGIIPGDIILSANQVPLKSISDFKDVIDEAKKSTKKLFLFIKRGNGNQAIVLSAN